MLVGFAKSIQQQSQGQYLLLPKINCVIGLKCLIMITECSNVSINWTVPLSSLYKQLVQSCILTASSICNYTCGTTSVSYMNSLSEFICSLIVPKIISKMDIILHNQYIFLVCLPGKEGPFFTCWLCFPARQQHGSRQSP